MYLAAPYRGLWWSGPSGGNHSVWGKQSVFLLTQKARDHPPERSRRPAGKPPLSPRRTGGVCRAPGGNAPCRRPGGELQAFSNSVNDDGGGAQCHPFSIIAAFHCSPVLSTSSCVRHTYDDTSSSCEPISSRTSQPNRWEKMTARALRRFFVTRNRSPISFGVPFQMKRCRTSIMRPAFYRDLQRTKRQA